MYQKLIGKYEQKIKNFLIFHRKIIKNKLICILFFFVFFEVSMLEKLKIEVY